MNYIFSQMYPATTLHGIFHRFKLGSPHPLEAYVAWKHPDNGIVKEYKNMRIYMHLMWSGV